LLFLFNFEFLPIAFLVVYVGAVAVLFLFVLMMLNIKLAELLENYYNIMPVGLLFGFVFVYQLIFLLRFEFELFEHLDRYSILFLHDFSNITTIKTNFMDLNHAFTNIKLLGFVLFSNFLYHFVISGFILLLAMIAAIVLTLQKFFITKTQNVYVQILKDYNTTVVSAF
jgi:NADH-quinone oxidoreductase subunit J